MRKRILIAGYSAVLVLLLTMRLFPHKFLGNAIIVAAYSVTVLSWPLIKKLDALSVVLTYFLVGFLAFALNLNGVPVAILLPAEIIFSGVFNYVVLRRNLGG